jgi:signal transduction histidine kinase
VARILVIDDEDALRTVSAEILRDAGYQVVEARTGAEGIEEVRRERPDLVLCDVNMPVMDGYSVLKVVRTEPNLASIPFLFMSGLGERESVRVGMSLGADDYLTKPVSSQELLEAIAVRLARLGATRQEAERQMDELRLGITVLLPHEMRTPLSVILGSAQALEALHESLPPASIKQLATGMTHAATRLRHTIENYLLYASLELERLAPSADTRQRTLGGTAGHLDVREAATTQAAEKSREADLRFELEETGVPMAPVYLRKVVAELVGNALKFSEPGTPVRVALTRAGADTQLEVADAGRGMTSEQVSQVTAFRQFDRAVLEQQGSGLGLALVKRIATLTGAQFELSSTPGAGSSARLRWPAP